MAAAMTETRAQPQSGGSSMPSQPPSRARAFTNASASSHGEATTPLSAATVESTTPNGSPSLHLRDGQWSYRPPGPNPDAAIARPHTPGRPRTPGRHSPAPSTPGASTPTPAFLSQHPISTTTSSQILPQARRPSETRRVRSDVLVPQARHMSITMGKRPSIVTGGYESSSEDDSDEASSEALASGKRSRDEPRARGQSIGVRAISGLPGSPISPTSGPALSSSPAKRHRGHPHPHSPTIAAPLSPGTLQGLGLMNSHATSASGRRRAQSLMSPPADPPSPGGSRRSSRLLRPPLASPLSPRRVASSSGIPSNISIVDRPSPLHSRMPSDSARSASMRSVNSIPEGHVDAGPSNLSREGSLRKQKLRDSRKRAFGSSLGLCAAPREALLSADQIQDLLSDVDVSSAIQRMNTAKPRRLSSYARDRSPSPPPAPPEPPQQSHPFLVSAPPALTTGDWPGRDRSASVASTIAPPQRSYSPIPSRLRGPSLSTVSDTDREMESAQTPIVAEADDGSWTDGGNSDAPTGPSVQAGHSGPSTLAESNTLTLPAAPASEPRSARSEGSPIPSPTPNSPNASNRKSSGRRRISGLFGTMRRKRDVSPPPQQTPPPAQPQPQPVHQTAHQHHQHNQEKLQRQSEHQERVSREQEMRAAEHERHQEELAQERMYRATIQVRSHPASQRRAQRAALHLDSYYAIIHDGLENPPKFNPLAVLRWSRRVEEQKAAKAKWEAEEAASRASGSLHAISRAGSVHSPQSDAFRISLDAVRRSTTRSLASTGEHVVAPGWHYSLSDVDAYTSCRGKVHFFIPPIESLPSPSSQRKMSLELRPRQSISSSVGEMDSSLNNDQIVALMQGPSSPVPVPDDGNMSSLSRTPSFDISRSVTRGQRGVPNNNSLSKSGSSLQAFKAPFEKLGNVARRNMALSVSPVGAMEMDEDPSRRPGWLSLDAPVGPPPGTAPVTAAPPEQQSHLAPIVSSTHGLRDKVRRGLSNVAGGASWNEAHTTASDDEHHGFRKLFRGSSKTRGGHAHTESSTSRVQALEVLQGIVDHERKLRHEITSTRHPTERERQAQEDLMMLEQQIYDEREALLNAARQRVEDFSNKETQMGSLITHYLSAVDQAKATFSTAADIDITFDNLDALRHPRRPAVAVDDESADSVAPLRGEESDRGGFSAGGGGGGTFSDSWNGRQRMRKQSIAPPLPNLTYVYAGYNRRSLVDPNLGVPVDPIRRVELACERARETTAEMAASRERTRERLQQMVDTINSLIGQKDLVRKWTTRTMDQISQLKDERDTLRLKIRGGIRPRLARFADSGIDLAARWILGVASVGFRLYRLVTGRGAWLPWALFIAIIAGLLGSFYIAGDPGDGTSPTLGPVA